MISETNTFSHPDTPPTTPSPTIQVKDEENSETDPGSQIRALKRQSSEALSERVVETMNSITNLLTGMEEQEGFQLKDDEYRMEPEETEVTTISLQSSIVLECESLSDISQEIDNMSVFSILDVKEEGVQQVSIEPPLEPVHPAVESETLIDYVEKVENIEDEITEETTGTTSHEVTGCETCEELSAESLVSDPEPLILITPQVMVAVHSAPVSEQHPHTVNEEKSKTSDESSTEELVSLSLTDETIEPILLNEDEDGIASKFKIPHSVDENQSLGTIEITVDADHIIAVQGINTSNDSLDLTTTQVIEPKPSDEHAIPQEPAETRDIPEATENPLKDVKEEIPEEDSDVDDVQTTPEDDYMKREEILVELGRVFVREETTPPSPPQTESDSIRLSDYQADELKHLVDIQEVHSGDEEDVPSSITVTSLRVESQPSPDIEENSVPHDKVENKLADTSTDSLLTPDEVDSSPEVVESSRKVPDIDIDFSLSNSGEKAVADGTMESTLDDIENQSSQAASEMPAESISDTEQIIRSSSTSSSSSSFSDGAEGRIKIKRRSTSNYVSSAKSKESIIHIEQPDVIETAKGEDGPDVYGKDLTETIDDTPQSTVNTATVLLGSDEMEDKARLEVNVPQSEELVKSKILDLAQESNDTVTHLKEEEKDIAASKDDTPLSGNSESEQNDVVVSKTSGSSSSSDSDHDDEKDTEKVKEKKDIPMSSSDTVTDTASIILTLDFGVDTIKHENQELVCVEVAPEDLLREPLTKEVVETNQEINVGGHTIPTIYLNDDSKPEEDTEIGFDIEIMVGNTERVEQTITSGPESNLNEVKEPSPIADKSVELKYVPPASVEQVASNDTVLVSNYTSHDDFSNVDVPITPPQAVLKRNSAGSISSSSSDSESETHSAYLVEHSVTIPEIESDDSSICSESDLRESMQRFNKMKRSLSADGYVEDNNRSFEGDLETITPDFNLTVGAEATDTDAAVKDSCENVSPSPEDIHIPLSVILSSNSSRKSSSSSSDSSSGAIKERQSPILLTKQTVDVSFTASTEDSNDKVIGIGSTDTIQEIDVKAFVDSQIEVAVARTLKLEEKPELTDEKESSQQIIVTNTTFSMLSDVPDVQIISMNINEPKIVSRKSSTSSSEDESKFPELHLALKGCNFSQDEDLLLINEESVLKQLESSIELETAAYLKYSSSSDHFKSASDASFSSKTSSGSEELDANDDENEFIEVTEELKELESSAPDSETDRISADHDEGSRYGKLIITTENEISTDPPFENPVLNKDMSLENNFSQPSIASSSSSSDKGSGSDGDGKTDLTEVTEIVEAEKLGYEDEAEIDVPQAVTVSEESPTIDKITFVNTPEESPTIDKVTLINTPDLLEANSDSDSLSEEEGFCESDAMQSILDRMTGSTISVTGEEVEDELRSLSSSSSRSTVARNEDDAETPEPPSETTGESRTTSAEPTEDSRMFSVEPTDEMRTPSVEPIELDEETTPEPPSLSPEPPTESPEPPNIELPSYSVISEEIDMKEIERRTMNLPETLRHDNVHTDALAFLSQDSGDDITEDKPHTNGNKHLEEKPHSQTLNDSSLGTYDLSSTLNTDPNLTVDSTDKLFLKTNWPKYDPVLGKSFAIACKVRLRGFELRDQDIKNNASIRLYKDEELLSVQPKFINGYFVFKIKNATLAESGWYSFTVNMLEYEATEGQDINIALKGDKNKRTKSMSSIGSLGSLGSLFSVNNKTQNRR